MAHSMKSPQSYSQDKAKNDGIIQIGSLRKLKNNKMKYFVLRTVSNFGRANLECYRCEEKFREGDRPSRVIPMSDVLNVDKTQVPDQQFTFAIFLKDEKYSLIAGFEDERDNWVEALKFVKKQSQPTVLASDFVWSVRIRNDGLAKRTKLGGECKLLKRGNRIFILQKKTDEIKVSFALENVKSSGYSHNFVLLEMGRSHAIGPGEIWIEADDALTAEDVHTVLFGCKLVRPRTCVGADRGKLMSGKMTNRRGTSDGSEKSKLRKTRTLFPFLKSKLGDIVGDVNPVLKSKRSHSASDISRMGVNQEGDYEKLKLLQQRSLPHAESAGEIKGDSKSSKKKKRVSLFRNMKFEVTRSAQDIHKPSSESRNTLPRDNRVSLLRSKYEKSISKSEQNIHKIASHPTANGSSGHSSRLANLKSLQMMHASSTSNLASSSPSSRSMEDVESAKGKTRPVTMSGDALENGFKSIFRKTKWRSFDKEAPEDSQAVSSEECSSIGSFGSNRSVDSSDVGNGPTASVEGAEGCITDEGYIPMNFGYNEDKPYANLNSSKHNSVYMLIRPDPEVLDSLGDLPDGQEPYMDMTSVRSFELEASQTGVATEAKSDHTNEAGSLDAIKDTRSLLIEDQEMRPDDPVVFRETKRSDQKPVPLPPKTLRYSSSSNEGSVFASGSWEDASTSKLQDLVDNPIPLPPRSRRDQGSHEISDCTRSSCDSSSDIENPVPLPPKTQVRLSTQMSVSEDEKPQRTSVSGDRRTTSVRNTSSGSEDWIPPLPKPYNASKNRSSLGDEEKLVRSSNMVGRPLPSLPRGVDPRGVKPRSESDRGPSLSPTTVGHCSASNERKENTPLYSVVDKKHKVLTSQNSVPLPPKLDRQSSQNSPKPEDVPSMTKTHGSEHSPLEFPLSHATFSPTTPEKKSKNRFRDIGKRMTVNFRQNKRSTLSPKKRMSEASSHFYVDTGATGHAEKIPDVRKGAKVSNSEPHPVEKLDDTSTNKSVKKEPFPVRPNYLELNIGVEKKSEGARLSKENIYSTVAETDRNENYRSAECSTILTNTTHQSNIRHIQQEHTRATRNYETVYTEVTLKTKTSPSMPIKGIKSLTRDKKKKVKNFSEAEEKIVEEFGLELTDVEAAQEPQRRTSQKIVSSPTKDGKGYENISLQDGIIRTPLEEVEGRPYMNLGFHKAKGKLQVENRKSADETAMRLLMNINSEKKISDELSVRRKSSADINPRKGSLDQETEEEASYVNVGRDRKLLDNSGCVISPGVTDKLSRQALEQMNEEETAYQNIPVLSSRRRQSSADGDSPNKGDIDILSRLRLNTPAEEFSESLYSNIGFKNSGSDGNTSPNKKRERPLPKPRPKKPERRKISQVPAEDRKISSSIGESGRQYDKVDISQKVGYTANGILDFADCSYVNVGSYKDDFDVGRNSEAPKPMAKCQSYENLIDEFQPRVNRKKSVEYGLAYADVQLRKDRLQDNEKQHESSECSSINAGKKNKNNVPLGKSKSAYTEIDFMKSQGISEAVRERRVESFESENERD